MNEEDVSEKSFLYVEFTEQDSTLFTWSGTNVSPLQLLAIASYLEITAKNALVNHINNQLQQQAMQEARNKIAKPGETGVVSGDEARALFNTLGK